MGDAERYAQCAAEVCQMAPLLVTEEIGHTDAANWILDLAARTCGDEHACPVHAVTQQASEGKDEKR